MSKRTLSIGAAAVSFAMIAAMPAAAATIQGFGSPSDVIIGGIVEDFNGNDGFTGNSINLGGVTISSTDSKDFRVTSSLGGLYNTTGVNLQSPVGYPDEFRFDFASVTDAFAFNFGAHDVSWTIAAYTATDTLVDSLTFAGIGGNSQGQYYGISGSNISYALLTASSSGDYILLDNLTYTAGNVSPVPVPAALPLLIFALGGLGMAARRRKAS